MLSKGIHASCIVDESYSASDVAERVLGVPVKGTPDDISPDANVVMAIGAPGRREKWFHHFDEQIYHPNLIHESAIIDPTVTTGIANQLFAGTYVGALAELGYNNIVYTGSIIEHETVIGDHCFISVNATICGRVELGDRCYIGAGAVIVDKVRICNDVTIGANSLVLSDIEEPGTYVGSPVRKIK